MRAMPGRLARIGPAAALAIALGAIWAITQPRTADLAAQAYRADLFGGNGFVVWDNGWFGGHQLLADSLVSPTLGSLVGLTALGLGSIAVSTVCAAELVARLRPDVGALPAAWFALAAAGDLFIGRITFALGTAVALVALVALTRGRAVAGAMLCGLCAITSPVVGLFLGLILVAAWGALPRRIVLVAGAALAGTLLVSAALFSDGGFQPDDLVPALANTLIAAAVLAALDPSERFLRRCAALYVGACAAAYVIPTPMGSNVARLGILALGPALLCARRRWGVRAVAACSCVVIVWQLWSPVTETVKASRSAAGDASYFAPLIGELRRLHVHNERVEVVPTSTRWESVYVALQFPLARGWETQLDRRYDALFYGSHITAAAYRRWLDRASVGYIAVSDSTPQRWGVAEAALLARAPGYLRPVWRDRHWRVFAVARSRPIVTGAALVDLDVASMELRFAHRGKATVAVHYTSYWRASAGACVAPTRDGSAIRVTAPAAGVVRITAPWRPAAVIDHDPCTPPR